MHDRPDVRERGQLVDHRRDRGVLDDRERGIGLFDQRLLREEGIDLALKSTDTALVICGKEARR